jgi:hypothetical protein
MQKLISEAFLARFVCVYFKVFSFFVCLVEEYICLIYVYYLNENCALLVFCEDC